MINGHGGNKAALADRLGCPVEQIVDMSSNLNPLGPPEAVEHLIVQNMAKIRSLPEPDARGMVQAFSAYMEIDPERSIAANGTTWFIYTLPLALKSKKALIVGPTYADYQDACTMHGVEHSLCLSTPESWFQPDLERIRQMSKGVDLVFICNPNNPTGVLFEKNDLVGLIKDFPDTVFVVDESYLPFVEDAESISLVKKEGLSNLVVLSSMSKIFTIPGLRTGFMTASKKVTRKVMTYYQPWTVNSLAQATVKGILDQPRNISPFYKETRAFVKKEKSVFFSLLKETEQISLFPTTTYFVLARLSGDLDAPAFCEKIGEHRILIRDCSNFQGLNQEFVRFSLKTAALNRQLADLIKQVLNHAG